MKKRLTEIENPPKEMHDWLCSLMGEMIDVDEVAEKLRNNKPFDINTTSDTCKIKFIIDEAPKGYVRVFTTADDVRFIRATEITEIVPMSEDGKILYRLRVKRSEMYYYTDTMRDFHQCR